MNADDEDELSADTTDSSQLQTRDISAYDRQLQQREQDSKTSSGDRRTVAVQRLVDMQDQSKHLSGLLAAKRQVSRAVLIQVHKRSAKWAKINSDTDAVKQFFKNGYKALDPAGSERVSTVNKNHF